MSLQSTELVLFHHTRLTQTDRLSIVHVCTYSRWRKTQEDFSLYGICIHDRDELILMLEGQYTHSLSHTHRQEGWKGF